MQDLKSRLLAILFAVTALNLLCFFETVQPINDLGSDFNTNRMRQKAKACLSAALSVIEKSTDDNGQIAQKFGNDDGAKPVASLSELKFRYSISSTRIQLSAAPIFGQQKLWLLHRALLI